MPSGNAGESAAFVNPYTDADVAAILRGRGWMDDSAAGAPVEAWLTAAAELLGSHALDRAALADSLGLVFEYDAQAILAATSSHIVLAREGAREVIRELANLILDGPEVDSDRLKEIINTLKAKLEYRGRELFYPIRLALAGRPGEGELDRVILLLDSAARLAFRVPVKGTRRRMLEFCAALE
jgi:hypothetical protein